jgi:hypothetical protein
MLANHDDLTDAALEAGRSPARWRFSSDALWRSARALLRVHLGDVRHGRAGTSTRDTHEIRLAAVIFRRRHVAPPPSVAPVYMMLAGLALEALVKGIIVAREPHRIGRGTSSQKLMLEWGAREHLSTDLVRRAGRKLTTEEGAVVDRLAMFVRWAGRYPVPKDPSELGPGWGESHRGAFWTKHDFEIVDQLRTELRKTLTDAMAERTRLDRAPELTRRAAALLELSRRPS